MATNNSKKSNSKSTTKKSPTSSKKKTTPNYQKAAVKTVKKAAKKNPKVFIIIAIVTLFAVGAGFAVWYFFLRKPQTTNEGVTINFLELGNWNTGDSTYIKAGDIDILIDAGSQKSSSTTIKSYVDQHCTDNKLEYVIATHAHFDHISGFVGSKENPGIFDTYKIGTLIDFSFISAETPEKQTQIYKDYVAKRESCLTSGNIEKHYTALQCVEQTDGAKKEYTLADGIKMTILDQLYYHERSSDENNHSVCTLFTQGSNHYLLTGDLEKKGEESLVERNNLPHCQLFKGGHHGSYTANTDTLLNAITPEAVCICCCCGSDEYSSNPDRYFPAQDAINRIAMHTDRIYVTTLSTSNEDRTFTSMNGNIVFNCTNGVDYTIVGSNNSNKLKETEWFQNNRTWPVGGK